MQCTNRLGRALPTISIAPRFNRPVHDEQVTCKRENRERAMQLRDPTRHHTPDDDPEPGTLGTGEDICPDCMGTGKQIDTITGKRGDMLCERCDGAGIIIEGIG